ncbi:MAG TPA: SPOR domain-containing protein [Acidobacteriaceae bacterium]|jgi:cell division septation protein DedD|nr:SPOR domain-containing protein [Acidobacteriaceae bacterium]
MAYLFETEEDEETGRGRRTSGRKGRSRRGEEDDGAEITLGTRSLLGIFFGLVLICSIFFGLGYSVGRGSGSKAAFASSGSESPVAVPNGNLGKPSAQQALTSAPETPAASGNPEDSAPALEPATDTGTQAGANPSPAAGSGASAAAATVTPAGFPSAAPGTATPVLKPAVAMVAPSGIMVQVAAISVSQDADILVDALKKRGYTAVIRNEPQDKLLHVQLGPFASRAEASAMRTKLLADGYNAVVK